MNKRALAWGRLAAHDPGAVQKAAARRALPRRLTKHPTGMHRSRGAGRASGSTYLTALSESQALRGVATSEFVERVRAAQESRAQRRTQRAGARPWRGTYFKLLAYKDEYEVARLYSDGSFQPQLEREFEG